MITFTVGEVAAATGGSLVADPEASIVEIALDSRSVPAGALFVAVVGETHDGHDHCAQALASGAVACLVSRPIEGPHILVPDTVVALGGLARAVVDRCPRLRIVALTGSSGKTSTKDLLAEVLRHFGSTIAPQGSFNNELGLPRTVLECTADTEFLVAEMGARGKGHIDYLCDIAPPTVGMVLNVGSAHISEFGNREAIADAKAEMVENVVEHGVAVLNRDDPMVIAMAPRASGGVLTFGRSKLADVRILDIELDEHGHPRVTLAHAGSTARVEPAVFGEHQGYNVAAAVAAAVALDLDFEQAAASLNGVSLASRWRMEVRESAGITVINDAYNANPESMAAGLRALASMGRGRRTWAVLGEMRELGETSTDQHDAIGRLAVRLNISQLVVVGEGARPIQMGAAHEGSWDGEAVFVPDAEAAVALLRDGLRPDDVVLVKASRAVGLERVAEALMAEPT